MSKISKRMSEIRKKVEAQLYPLVEACQLAKECALSTFDESIDVNVMLGVDPRKSDQAVRGATVLPNGTGRTVRVAVFAQGAQAEAAKAAGADIVGFEDLAESIKQGNMDFDVVIATPDSMRVVGQLGQVLGPRGLMPNPKVGTVSADAAKAVANAKSGQVRFRTEKGGIVHCTIGKASFSPEALQQNLLVLVTELKKLKPAAAKGIYLQKLSISTTMGPGIQVDLGSLTN